MSRSQNVGLGVGGLKGLVSVSTLVSDISVSASLLFGDVGHRCSVVVSELVKARRRRCCVVVVSELVKARRRRCCAVVSELVKARRRRCSVVVSELVKTVLRWSASWSRLFCGGQRAGQGEEASLLCGGGQRAGQGEASAA